MSCILARAKTVSKRKWKRCKWKALRSWPRLGTPRQLPIFLDVTFYLLENGYGWKPRMLTTCSSILKTFGVLLRGFDSLPGREGFLVKARWASSEMQERFRLQRAEQLQEERRDRPAAGKGAMAIESKRTVLVHFLFANRAFVVITL